MVSGQEIVLSGFSRISSYTKPEIMEPQISHKPFFIGDGVFAFNSTQGKLQQSFNQGNLILANSFTFMGAKPENLDIDVKQIDVKEMAKSLKYEAVSNNQSLMNAIFSNADLVMGVCENGDSKNEALHYAIEAQNQASLEWLLKQEDIDVNFRNSKGDTPLQVAVKANSIDAVRLLLERDDVDVNCKQIMSIPSAIMHHIKLGGQYFELNSFLYKNTNIDTYFVYREFFAPVYYRCRERIEYLRANPKVLKDVGTPFFRCLKDKDCEAPLYIALRNGNYEVMDLLFGCKRVDLELKKEILDYIFCYSAVGWLEKSGPKFGTKELIDRKLSNAAKIMIKEFWRHEELSLIDISFLLEADLITSDDFADAEIFSESHTILSSKFKNYNPELQRGFSEWYNKMFDLIGKKQIKIACLLLESGCENRLYFEKGCELIKGLKTLIEKQGDIEGESDIETIYRDITKVICSYVKGLEIDDRAKEFIEEKLLPNEELWNILIGDEKVMKSFENICGFTEKSARSVLTDEQLKEIEAEQEALELVGEDADSASIVIDPETSSG